MRLVFSYNVGGYSFAPLQGAMTNAPNTAFNSRSRAHQYTDKSEMKWWEYIKSSSDIIIEGANFSRIIACLNHISSLPYNWDGEGALAISKRVLNNVFEVLLISDDYDWRNWIIGPDPNATLGLQSKVTDACISIGSEEYSYYAEINGKEFHGNHVAFSPVVFWETMRKIG